MGVVHQFEFDALELLPEVFEPESVPAGDSEVELGEWVLLPAVVVLVGVVMLATVVELGEAVALTGLVAAEVVEAL